MKDGRSLCCVGDHNRALLFDFTHPCKTPDKAIATSSVEVRGKQLHRNARRRLAHLRSDLPTQIRFGRALYFSLSLRQRSH